MNALVLVDIPKPAGHLLDLIGGKVKYVANMVYRIPKI